MENQPTELFCHLTAVCLHSIQGVAEKNAQSLCHHFATVHHTVMRFSERNRLHDKDQCFNTAIKYSLLWSWPVNSLKTKLSVKSLRQIRGISKVHAKPSFTN